MWETETEITSRAPMTIGIHQLETNVAGGLITWPDCIILLSVCCVCVCIRIEMKTCSRYHLFTTDLFNRQCLTFGRKWQFHSPFRNHKCIFNKFQYFITLQIDLSHCIVLFSIYWWGPTTAFTVFVSAFMIRTEWIPYGCNWLLALPLICALKWMGPIYSPG